MKERIGAIDAWGTLITKKGATRWPDSFHHIFKRYKSGPKMTEGMDAEEMIADMDEADVDIVILSSFEYEEVQIISNAEVAEIVKKFPKRFIGCGTVDPRQKPMKVLDDLKRMVEEHDMVALRLEPYAYGDGMTGAPPNQKMYWPIYAKCCELDLPVTLQVGHTGPLMPSEPGRPIYLDEGPLLPRFENYRCSSRTALARRDDDYGLETSECLHRNVGPPAKILAGFLQAVYRVVRTGQGIVGHRLSSAGIQTLYRRSQRFGSAVRN